MIPSEEIGICYFFQGQHEILWVSRLGFHEPICPTNSTIKYSKEMVFEQLTSITPLTSSPSLIAGSS